MKNVRTVVKTIQKLPWLILEAVVLDWLSKVATELVKLVTLLVSGNVTR